MEELVSKKAWAIGWVFIIQIQPLSCLFGTGWSEQETSTYTPHCAVVSIGIILHPQNTSITKLFVFINATIRTGG